MPEQAREIRLDVFSMEQLLELVDAPVPVADGRGAGRLPGFGAGARPASRSLFRDLYLDTADDSLRRRGVVCRLRLGADDRRLLMLRIAGRTPASSARRVESYVSAVKASDPRSALLERTTVGRRLQAIIDPERLQVRAELEVERYARVVRRDWLRRPTVVVLYEQVTVRRGSGSRSFQQLRLCGVRGGAAGLEHLAAAFERAHGVRRIGADTRERAELMLKWMESEYMLASISRAWPVPAPASPNGDHRGAAAPFLNSELSLLEFNARVLAMAEDLATPLAERLRFLAILASNLDEFFMVRVAGLRHAGREQIEEASEGAASRQAQLDLIALRVSALVARQYRCYRGCMAELAAFGARALTWAELDDAQRAHLRERFREEIYPALTPLALTLAPGHPFPRPSHLSLSLAVVLLDRYGGAPRLACVELPNDVPRLLALPDSADLVLLEDVVRANLDLLYPAARVEQAYAFRATRAGDLALDEDTADDLLEAVDAATRLRGANAVVRVEVDRGMPLMIRELVLNELREEQESAAPPPAHADVYEVDGPLDLRFLHRLPLPADDALHYPPFDGVAPVAAGQPLWDAMRDRDLLVHHPFEPFDDTVLRFFRDAATDPDVVSIRTTLYRTGDGSPVVEALREAATRGKQVAAFVELKARFEEERNVAATRALEEAGGHVVYGLVGLKNHAKVALVVRREHGRLQRYAHVGTGNYNAVTARQYTDLSLFSAAAPLCDDVTEFFNALTGTSRPPERLTHGALVAPKQLLGAVLDRIERETAHARAGAPAGIRIKVNGLSHPDVVRALYTASEAGVRVSLVVRGICTLRPDVPGLSENIRVVAIVGRLLEHSRIYEFTNAGDREYLIGSSDLRPRNLRRRVELLVPVRGEGAERLRRLLDAYESDPTGWELTADGDYRRRRQDAPSTQERLIADSAGVSAAPGSLR